MNKDFEMVIGLEVHAELKTATKIFCGCSTKFGAEPNTQCCPVCTGMPGSLPVLNLQVVDYAVELVKNFNDIIAVQTTDLEASSDTSFGSLWDTFSLDLTIDTEDGTVLLEKSYGAGEEIDLVMPEYDDEGPEPAVEEDVPKKA